MDVCDYREIDGCYDAVISVGMIEAVGYRLWPRYFHAIEQLVKPGCRVVMRMTLSHIGFGAVFARMWEFYLAYAEAGFRSGYLNADQWTFVNEAVP